MAQAPKVYLDDQGNPLGTSTGTMLDDQGNPIQSEASGPQGSALGRFAGGVGEMLNPITAAQGIYQTVRHPIDTVTGIASQTGEHLTKARNAGSLNEFANEATAAIPVVGPILEGMSQQAKSGDIAGAAGKGVGLVIGPKVYGAAAGKVGQAAKAVTSEGAAAALERGAASRVVDVMAPKVGPNKTRFGGMAEDVAPTIAKDDVSKTFSRQGLHEGVATKLGEAETALDEASDARLSARTFPTKPIIDDLLKKRAALTAQAVEGSSPIPSITTVEGPSRAVTPVSFKRSGDGGFSVPDVPSPNTRQVPSARPVGRDVVPAPNRERVAVIDQAIKEIKALGPAAQYEPLRRIRQAYDAPAKIKYSPSMTTDFLKKSGEASGAADVTGALRERLAQMDPQTATANAQYSFWRKANDVLEATAEVERVRPKVGRQIASRIAGTFIGEAAAGVPGMVAGFVGGPIVESMLSSGTTTKLQTARLMTKLAGAIRRGDLGHVNALTTELKNLSGGVTSGVKSAAEWYNSGGRPE